MSLALLPQPQRLKLGTGYFSLPPTVSIGIADVAFLPAAREIQAFCFNGVQKFPALRKKGRKGSVEAQVPIHILHSSARDTICLSAEPKFSTWEYRIKIDASGIRLEAGSAPGAFHAVQTLRQILLPSRPIPFLEIHDWPDLEERGLYYDVCRGRVPKLERLFELTEKLSHYKINQLQLYIEHTFLFRGHPGIGKDASPLTPEEILSLDAFCQSRQIELIPSLASFGHLSTVLKNPQYHALAEDWGIGKYVSPEAPEDFAHTGWSLAPANPAIYQFLDSLYAEFLPLFSSRRFNACCDETFDLGWGQSYELCRQLGKGRVYLEHIKKINDLTKKYGKSLMIWGDIIRQYPQLTSEIPKDVTVLDWGYGHSHDFDSLSDFRNAGLKFLACPGTSSWLGLFPRIPQACANIAGFARAAKKNGAAGLLNTDWGDGGHYNFMENSWHGYLFGAEQAWNIEANPSDFTRRFVNAFFGCEDQALASALDEFGDISFTCPAGGGAGIWQDVLFALPDNPIFQMIASNKATYISGGKIVTARNRLDAASLRGIHERLEYIRCVFSNSLESNDPQGILPYWVYAVDATRLAVRRLLEYGLDSPPDPEERRSIHKDLRNLRRRFKKLWMDRNRTSEIGITLARFDRVIRGDSLKVELEETGQGKVRLTVSNKGPRKASGALALAAFPEGAVRFEGGPDWHFQHLRPGFSQSTEFSFHIAEGIVKFVLKTSCTNPNANKAVLGIFQRKCLSIPKIKNMPGSGKDLAAFLVEKGAHCQLMREGSPVADVWIALQASALAVLVSARDHCIARGVPVWKESCFELFAKTETTEIAQVFLCPSTPDFVAAAFELDRSASAIVPSQAITVEEVERKEKDYKLVAQVPLSALSLPPDSPDFRMEMVLTSVISPGHGYQRTPLFHPVEDPSTNSGGFGLIKM